MTPAQLTKAGHKLYGRKKWKVRLAEALAVNVSTIHRICKRPEIPGPVEVAVKGLLNHRLEQIRIEKEARKLGLVPRKKRKKVLVPKSPKKEKKREKTVDLGPVADVVEPIVGD